MDWSIPLRSTGFGLLVGALVVPVQLSAGVDLQSVRGEDPQRQPVIYVRSSEGKGVSTQSPEHAQMYLDAPPDDQVQSGDSSDRNQRQSIGQQQPEQRQPVDSEQQSMPSRDQEESFGFNSSRNGESVFGPIPDVQSLGLGGTPDIVCRGMFGPVPKNYIGHNENPIQINSATRDQSVDRERWTVVSVLTDKRCPPREPIVGSDGEDSRATTEGDTQSTGGNSADDAISTGAGEDGKGQPTPSSDEDEGKGTVAP